MKALGSTREMNGGWMIYCDMDGVLTDFDKRFEEISNGISPKKYTLIHGEDKFWDLIKNAREEFWSEMEWMPDGIELWNYIEIYEPKILSAPSRERESRTGKQYWVNTRIPGFDLILRNAEEKQQFANPNSILIDDRPSNIEQWRNKGGIGILHTSTSSTIKQLKQLGL